MTLTTREADAAFADLICADPQWLDAEFDALVAACSSEPPGPPPPAPPRVPPRPGSTPPPSRRTAPGPAVTAVPATGPDMAGSARPRRISPAVPRAAAPAPDPPGGGGPHDSESAPGHRPDGPGKETGHRTTQPNLIASDTAGLPGGSPAAQFPGASCCRARAAAIRTGPGPVPASLGPIRHGPGAVNQP